MQITQLFLMSTPIFSSQCNFFYLIFNIANFEYSINQVSAHGAFGLQPWATVGPHPALLTCFPPQHLEKTWTTEYFE